MQCWHCHVDQTREQICNEEDGETVAVEGTEHSTCSVSASPRFFTPGRSFVEVWEQVSLNGAAYGNLVTIERGDPKEIGQVRKSS